MGYVFLDRKGVQTKDFILNVKLRVRRIFKQIISYKKFWRGIKSFVKIGLVVLFIISIWIFVIPSIQEFTLIQAIKPAHEWTAHEEQLLNKRKKALERDISKKRWRIKQLTPSSTYLIVNSETNRFYLYKGEKLLRVGICSTGSNILLENSESDQWIFKTPKGIRRIQGKNTSPVWRKPDWAFVEEGLEIPPKDHPSRYELGVLGDYSLSMGHGYLIHGTLYQRFLGLPVTHGCIRLGDDDLKEVYNKLKVGSYIYIF